MDICFKVDEGIFNYRTACVWIHNDKILIHKNKKDDFWALPGGRVKIGEASQNSIVRECYEELGVHIHVDRLLWIVENFFEFAGREFHEIGLYYTVSSEDHSLYDKEQPFYGIEGEKLIYRWVTADELQNLKLHPLPIKEKLFALSQNIEQLIVEE
ncbi:NUDIX hydrolase [Viridibacillus sp. YIM B01967]|uniref:NUDIX hydrolase n=1 Tax=Viridibacillus soli TaxID=2798301 RepID=A0ABS1H5G0_9BACL|nr:NUDIX hydrolase [Viridibacillus soli]MBK3494650.1 NUDIX hydrolase [Viridibacillus soli]